jgi:molybdopterin-containing oxidoreductase family iron-sulfur binding subunit
MGASLGLAGLTGSGCIRVPEEKLAPYAHRPHNRMPGVPVSYATAMEIGGIAQGLLVTSYDGRPIKIEGNPSHPLNRGTADALAQAAVLGLYDPDRSRGVIRRDGDGQPSQVGWEEFARWSKTAFSGDGRGICILCEPSMSLSLDATSIHFRGAMPKLEWYEYEPLAARLLVELGLGLDGPVDCVLDLTRAKVIVSLDADLFGGGNPMAIKYARDFAAGRRLHETTDRAMNRLYVVESVPSITGACADHRRPLPASGIGALVGQIARGLGLDTGPAADKVESGIDPAFIERLTADLKANRAGSVVVAGRWQPPAVHAWVAAINAKLGNNGHTVYYWRAGWEREPSQFSHLVAKMHAGEVETLLILGGNPVFDAPADLNFATALKKVKNSIHLGLYDDETSRLCRWHLSQAHFLEAWGDARTYDGTLSLVQPVIEPLCDGRSPIEVLALILGQRPPLEWGELIFCAAEVGEFLNKRPLPEDVGYQIVRHGFRGLLRGSLTEEEDQRLTEDEEEWKWKKALAEGVADGIAWNLLDPAVQPSVAPPPLPRPAKGEYEVVFFADGKVYDGRFANNGWLQEMPDPMTRLTWDNAALMNARTAERIGVKRDELVALQAAGTPEIEVPVLILPGVADGVIGLALGYGRTAAGNIGDGVGRNAYLLRTSQSPGWRSGVKARPTGKMYKLATVQDHHVLDTVGQEAIEERVPELVHELVLADVLRAEGAGPGSRSGATAGLSSSVGSTAGQASSGTPALPQIPKSPNPQIPRGALSIFDEHRLDGRSPTGGDQSHVPAHDFHRWGLAVDLSLCTGCGACVVACQAENNVPIVGKEQVLLGREMQWIRIDRYFRQRAHGPASVHQPVLCMQCENAPCEEVCPVAATTHSGEGLNMMTYNRCVGTRYCANNCPYKVRRFNFFDYNCGTLKDMYTPNLIRAPLSELLRMQKNPEVTVRMRGVMEKCTYCIQRIEAARIAAKREGDRPLREGEIQTACQQTCPTGALVFGDLNDPASRVSKLDRLARTYGLLDAELNTKPRTRYVARVRNPAPGLDEGKG